jgi:hypothetical protein
VTSTAIIYRGNTVASNGGWNIGNAVPTVSIRDVVIEHNTVAQSDPDKAMQIAAALLNTTCIARRNTLPTLHAPPSLLLRLHHSASRRRTSDKQN